MNVEAALSDTLPAAVLLGRDVPELDSLLQETRGARARRKSLTQDAEEAMVVTTRSRARRKTHAEETENPAQGEEQETVGDSDHEQEQWEVGHGLDDELFVYIIGDRKRSA